MAAVGITYRKTRAGAWVAYGPSYAIKAGATVTVAKRDGTTKQETITSVGKTFTADGQSMVYGYLAPATATRPSGTAGNTARSHTCDECGERSGRIPRRDSSGIAGHVCSRCDRCADYELSFA